MDFLHDPCPGNERAPTDLAWARRAWVMQFRGKVGEREKEVDGSEVGRVLSAADALRRPGWPWN